jgi:hypothetical protein
MDVANWLRALGLERYEATFRENDVDPELLPNLGADALKELGITSLGHRRVCLKRSPRYASKARRPVIRFGFRPTRRPARPGAPVGLRPLPNAARSA